MSMDGIYRPSQYLGYTDTLGNLDAAERAALSAKNSGEVHQNQALASVNKDPQEQKDGQNQQESQERHEGNLEKDLQDIISKKFSITFRSDVEYRFIYNDAENQIELLDASTNEVILTLSPEEFIKITEHLRLNAGIMTDYTA